ncbi:hypothetical protein ACFW9B_32255, partial [Streptomyces yangpuensis]
MTALGSAGTRLLVVLERFCEPAPPAAGDPVAKPRAGVRPRGALDGGAVHSGPLGHGVDGQP